MKTFLWNIFRAAVIAVLLLPLIGETLYLSSMFAVGLLWGFVRRDWNLRGRK